MMRRSIAGERRDSSSIVERERNKYYANLDYRIMAWNFRMPSLHKSTSTPRVCGLNPSMEVRPIVRRMVPTIGVDKQSMVDRVSNMLIFKKPEKSLIKLFWNLKLKMFSKVTIFKWINFSSPRASPTSRLEVRIVSSAGNTNCRRDVDKKMRANRHHQTGEIFFT